MSSVEAGAPGGGTARRELVVTFTREQIAAYAEASGDRNPIHLDDEAARAAGLPGVIAHGMLQMGLLARVAGDPARLRRLSCRFAEVVAPGDTVTFRGEETNGRVELTAVNQDGRAVITRGRAELAPSGLDGRS
ncbi:MAG TPA: MaoC/PaaZ C-terminal domain-containing protein [Candidatus Dormibacteraeota bacterium]|nr:MaoC/PaaZ C-terminal domain-containing protein [Candidatus Dormibacteraeota bacterium]